MGQLEAYSINEIYMTGMLVGLFLNYFAEEDESDTFESFKPYFYSASFLSLKKKTKNFKLNDILISNPKGGVFKSLSFFKFNKIIKMTKTIDSFPLWQDASLLDFKVDKHIVRLQQKFTV